MKKRILVIGGTYFLGRAFVNLMVGEEGVEITLLHRGTGALGAATEPDNNSRATVVKLIFADRHDVLALKGIDHESYDAVVDFCAYASGDIANLLENINAEVKQYIFISTVDVYMHGTGLLQNEDAPFEDRNFGGDAGAYISGKVALEKEISAACETKGCSYTVLRPVFIYGPGNYAPRESIYFQWIDRARQIINPSDAAGEFQLVYVGDVARAIKLVIGTAEALNKCYNVCDNRMYDYKKYADLLMKATDVQFVSADVTVQTVNEKGIPLPFPLTKEESNYYDGSRLKALGMKYSDDVASMAETYRYWKNQTTTE